MQNFGKFIDDIRKEIKELNVYFKQVDSGEIMTIELPKSQKKFIVDTTIIGKIKYDTPEYLELLEMTIETLNDF